MGCCGKDLSRADIQILIFRFDRLRRPMASNTIPEQLINHLADLDEAFVLDTVRRLLSKGYDPLTLIKDCEEGMKIVGERYERREYYLSALIMGGEIFRQAMDLTQPFLEQRLSGNASGRVLLGTVQGDIHNIGKGIAEVALTCFGFTVEDLGVDVPPERFVERVIADPPDIVGLSGLITLAYDAMKETVTRVRALSDQGLPSVPIIIGGGMLDEKVRALVGADYWTTDALEGVKICRKIMEDKRGHASPEANG
jgi:methanogenic corrinoid protein MtbC1